MVDHHHTIDRGCSLLLNRIKTLTASSVSAEGARVNNSKEDWHAVAVIAFEATVAVARSTDGSSTHTIENRMFEVKLVTVSFIAAGFENCGQRLPSVGILNYERCKLLENFFGRHRKFGGTEQFRQTPVLDRSEFG